MDKENPQTTECMFECTYLVSASFCDWLTLEELLLIDDEEEESALRLLLTSSTWLSSSEVVTSAAPVCDSEAPRALLEQTSVSFLFLCDSARDWVVCSPLALVIAGWPLGAISGGEFWPLADAQDGTGSERSNDMVFQFVALPDTGLDWNWNRLILTDWRLLCWSSELTRGRNISVSLLACPITKGTQKTQCNVGRQISCYSSITYMHYVPNQPFTCVITNSNRFITV